MKKIFMVLSFLSTAMLVKAQYRNNDERRPNTYNDNNSPISNDRTFVGGSISLGFGSGSFGVGANPEIGYSLSQFIDAGVIVNLNYNSQKYDDNYDYNYDGRVSSFNYGAGVFVRAYPVHFLFLQLQPEENWITYKDKSYINNLSGKTTVNATSLIGGIGYTQRMIGQGSYFFMVGLDLLNNINSPYRDAYGGTVPIIRGGFDIYLHHASKKKYHGDDRQL